MPHLVQMDRKYSKKGMVLIGAEVQSSSVEAIEELVDEHKIKFTVTRGITGPNLSRGIPHSAVFDVNGDLIHHGHPSDPATLKAIKKALKAVTLDDADGAADDPFGKRKVLIEERGWTNADGKELVAALVSLNGKMGNFRFANGRKFEYDITKLSADDQAMIKEKASAMPAESP